MKYDRNVSFNSDNKNHHSLYTFNSLWKWCVKVEKKIIRKNSITILFKNKVYLKQNIYKVITWKYVKLMKLLLISKLYLSIIFKSKFPFGKKKKFLSWLEI